MREFLDDFATAYIDDILVYSNLREEHKIYVTKILEALRKASLQLDIEKCEFFVQEVHYLGMIITTRKLKINLRKIATIQD